MEVFMRKTLFLAILLIGWALPALAADYVDPTTGMEFVLIKGKPFDMGDLRKKDPFAVPAHKVAIGDFYMGKYEVTFAQYDKFCAETKRDQPDDAGWGRDNRPVINVSWQDATDFAAWLSKKSGKTFRLPSEAEWEFAAKSGLSTPFWWGKDPVKGIANCKDCGSEWSGQMTAPVGSFDPNPYGLFDMTGNVYEWCYDVRNDNYQAAPNDGTPWLTGISGWRITRGGSWYQHASEMRYYVRSWDRDQGRYNDVGFRLVMEP
jgi:formylglycine-generating enzyme required for sulfatase activity